MVLPCGGSADWQTQKHLVLIFQNVHSRPVNPPYLPPPPYTLHSDKAMVASECMLKPSIRRELGTSQMTLKMSDATHIFITEEGLIIEGLYKGKTTAMFLSHITFLEKKSSVGITISTTEDCT